MKGVDDVGSSFARLPDLLNDAINGSCDAMDGRQLDTAECGEVRSEELFRSDVYIYVNKIHIP